MTPAQTAALAAGRAAKKQKREQAKKEGRMTAQQRWAMLLDGTLTVKDLDDEEVSRMKVKGKDGCFSGTKTRTMPSHLVSAWQREAVKRANDKLRTAAPEAVQTLLDIGNNPEAKDTDRIRALMYLVDRSLGKVPETLRIEGESKFDAMLAESVGLERDSIDDSQD